MGNYGAVARAAGRVATGLLGWTPDQFWRATPAELWLALEGRFGDGPAPFGSAELAKLRERLSDG
jgi:uncharacterized phage protein (TIGR02216 family)